MVLVRFPSRRVWRTLLIAIPASVLLFADDSASFSSSGQNCSFTANPEAFLAVQSRIQNQIYNQTRKLKFARLGAKESLVQPDSIPQVNFIDQEIFGKLSQQGVPSARLTTDEEFVRRIYLDLSGRIPTADQVRNFVADASPNKRNDLIDKLLYSPEFTDKWTVWFGDLLQNTAGTLSTSNINRQIDGRNAFFTYLQKSIDSQKSIRDLAWEVMADSGNNYMADTGMVNFMAGAQVSMGPNQDTYDMMMVKSVGAFLGLSHYDCLGCHNGRGHLDLISVWGKNHTRMDAWRMSAFFSRTRWVVNGQNQAARQYTDPSYNSTDILDVATGQYDLNVTYGNRPAHCANALPPDPKTGRCLATASVTPQYRDGSTPGTKQSWRASFADSVVNDPMFARNFANRIWKQLFNLGLVDPVDTLDPDRLDPKNPPPDGWAFQATHPELLEKLAGSFVNSGYNLREFVRGIVQSSAYQLSSQYDGDWRVDYVPLFARHYPRRLDGEEVHDAIAQGTGVPGKYLVQATVFRTSPSDAVQMFPDPVVWAMKLPDTQEPRSNGAVSNFMNNFIRGNRDTQPRSQAGSILQQLALMNDSFVNNRTRVAASPVLAAIAKLPNDQAILNEIFLTFLSRMPSDRERTHGLNFLAKYTTPAAKATAVEDMAWVAINKVDFLFSY